MNAGAKCPKFLVMISNRIVREFKILSLKDVRVSFRSVGGVWRQTDDHP